MQTLEDRLSQVRNRIHIAESEFNRNPGSVQLLAVSKTQTVAQISAAYTLGLRNFGENYLQEAQQKIQQLQHLSINWHFIGHIQTNKTRTVAQLFNWVHSVDRVKIAKRLSEQRPTTLEPLNICLQINIDHQSNKSGFCLQDLPAAAAEIQSLPHIKLRGLMAIPKARNDFSAQLETFRQLQQAQQALQNQGIYLDTLSIGMSRDLEAAIAAGATIIRIGTALFGPRTAVTEDT